MNSDSKEMVVREKKTTRSSTEASDFGALIFVSWEDDGVESDCYFTFSVQASTGKFLPDRTRKYFQI